VLAGTDDAIVAARSLLAGGGGPTPLTP
jgi:hypothetical protein